MPRYDHPDDDIDADHDERYRRRARRYGDGLTEEEEEAEEKDREEGEAVARKKCRWPGILHIVAGVIGFGGNIVIPVLSLSGAAPGASAAVATIMFAILWGIPLLLGLVFSVFQILAGVMMLRRRMRGLVITGTILGCLPVSVGAVIGWAAAVWTFLVLSDPDVQDVFDRATKEG